MNTKQAIEVFENINIPGDELLKMKIKNVKKLAKLLQQGEKYKQMWKEYKRKNGYYLIGVKDDRQLRVGYTIGDEMEILEDKYFPKQIIEEAVKGITEQIKEGAEVAKEEAETDGS